MANCYRCGRPILDTKYHLRRRVKTGGYERKRFSGSKATLVQIHYGMRVVCTKCSYAIDRAELRRSFTEHLQVLIALVVLLLVLWLNGW